MAEKRSSARVKEAEQRKVLDEATRRLRTRKALERLLSDNYHEDPHGDLVLDKNVPKFEDSFERKKPKKVRLKTEPFKGRFRKNFTALLEEESVHFRKGQINYLTAQVPPSKYPPRHFCSVCGFASNYTCVHCGTRFCCVPCYKIHQDTRCLKWTA